MKILAVDTAANSCGVALLDEGYLVAEITHASGETHSKHLLGQIRSVLGMASVAMEDLDGFAVSAGPGSFTGIRIGISTVKGLALACGKPAVGVSTLDALAAGIPFASQQVYSMLDARRREIYCAGYILEGGVLTKNVEDRVLSPDIVAGEIKDSAIMVGSGAQAYRDLFMESCGGLVQFAPECLNTVRAALVGQLGAIKLAGVGTGDDDLLTPIYLRKSDAELTFKG